MKIKSTIVSAIFLLSLFGGGVLAAQHETGAQGGMQQDSAGQQAGQMQQQDGLKQAGMHKAGDLIGKTVMSKEGNELGSIENMVISQDGRVEYIILSRGGTMGVGGDLVPVPWQAANLSMEQDQLTADLDESKLENAPTVSEDMANFEQPGFEQELQGYYGTEGQQQTSPGMQKDKSGMQKDK